MSLDRQSRFVIAWSLGESEAAAAPEVVALTRARSHGREGVPWISDGHRIYERAVTRVYRDPQRTGKRGRPRLLPTPGVGLTQMVKVRKGRRVVRVEVRERLGEAVECPYTVCEERLNGVLRDRLNCLTRKTHAFAKQTRTWEAAVGLCFFEHNWLRPHKALRRKVEGLPDGRWYERRTPAMAIGLTDHLWSWEEFLSLPCYPHAKE